MTYSRHQLSMNSSIVPHLTTTTHNDRFIIDIDIVA